MSRVILCNGKKANNPYFFKLTGMHIYTIEELCFCLRASLDLLDEGSIDREMAIFLRDELELTERGNLLEQLVLTKADLRSRLVVIFCSCDYFDEEEIKHICDELEHILSMSEVERRKRKADRYMHEGSMRDAVREYRAILIDPECSSLETKEQGDIKHNLAVAEIQTGRFDNAAMLFKEAYELNSSRETLQAYLYALKLGKHEDAYINECRRLLDSHARIDRLEQELTALEDNLEQSGELSDVDRMRVLTQQGRVSEADRIAHDMIETFKRGYRLNSVE